VDGQVDGPTLKPTSDSQAPSMTSKEVPMPNIQGFDAACEEYGRPTLVVTTYPGAASTLWHQEEAAPYDDWSSWIEFLA
jgi:hypothetical protein